MTQRILPNFLIEGDRQLTPLILSSSRACRGTKGDTRMRAMMGLPPREVLPAEGTPARKWLRHVEAGRIGGN